MVMDTLVVQVGWTKSYNQAMPGRHNTSEHFHTVCICALQLCKDSIYCHHHHHHLQHHPSFLPNRRVLQGPPHRPHSRWENLLTLSNDAAVEPGGRQEGLLGRPQEGLPAGQEGIPGGSLHRAAQEPCHCLLLC